MPVYEYACRNCGKKFEIFAKSFEALANANLTDQVRERVCECGAIARLIVSPATVVLKGDGWAKKSRQKQK